MTGWHFITGLSLRNARTAPQSVSVEIFDNDWDPLPVIVNGESELAGRATWVVPAEDSREFVLTHPGGALRGGWVRLASAEPSTIQVVVIARFYNGNALILESGVSTDFSRQNPSRYRTIELRMPPAPRRQKRLSIAPRRVPSLFSSFLI